MLDFYSAEPSGNSNRKKTLSEWTSKLQTELGRKRGQDVERMNSSWLRWTDSVDTMVVTFGEVPVGARVGPVKRQYWMRQGQQ